MMHVHLHTMAILQLDLVYRSALLYNFSMQIMCQDNAYILVQQKAMRINILCFVYLNAQLLMHLSSKLKHMQQIIIMFVFSSAHFLIMLIYPLKNVLLTVQILTSTISSTISVLSALYFVSHAYHIKPAQVAYQVIIIKMGSAFRNVLLVFMLIHQAQNALLLLFVSLTMVITLLLCAFRIAQVAHLKIVKFIDVMLVLKTVWLAHLYLTV